MELLQTQGLRGFWQTCPRTGCRADIPFTLHWHLHQAPVLLNSNFQGKSSFPARPGPVFNIKHSCSAWCFNAFCLLWHQSKVWFLHCLVWDFLSNRFQSHIPAAFGKSQPRDGWSRAGNEWLVQCCPHLLFPLTFKHYTFHCNPVSTDPTANWCNGGCEMCIWDG